MSTPIAHPQFSDPLATMVYHMVFNLVDHPEQIVLTEKLEGENYTLDLKIAPQDIGKVIGKQGRMAHAIRSVLHGASIRSKKKTVLTIQS